MYPYDSHRYEGHKYWNKANKTKLKGFVRYLKDMDRRLTLRIKNTGAWLIVHGTTVSGTVLSATEFWDFLWAHYNAPPPLTSRATVTDVVPPSDRVAHLSAGTRILVIVRHNKIHDRILYLV